MLPLTPGATKIPLAFPTIVLFSMTLPVSAELGSPIPKLLPCPAYPFPLIRFARSRLRELPASHMPPQGDAPFPFRTDTFRMS